MNAGVGAHKHSARPAQLIASEHAICKAATLPKYAFHSLRRNVRRDIGMFEFESDSDEATYVGPRQNESQEFREV